MLLFENNGDERTNNMDLKKDSKPIEEDISKFLRTVNKK